MKIVMNLYMKQIIRIIYPVFVLSILLAACGRRNIPAKSSNTELKPKIAPDRVDHKQYVKRATILDSVHNASEKIGSNNGVVENPSDLTAKAAVSNAPIVVIDSHGVLQIDSLNLPPNVSHNLDSLSQAVRAYTPNEAKNLAFRFKEIPPRILYVPDNLAKKGVKGYYYRYENKFWYWKKDDGFFYLDENYYK